MAILTFSWFLDVVIILSSVLLAFYTFYLKQVQFWRKLNVPHSKPTFPFGNLSEVGTTKNIGVLLKNIYDEHPDAKFIGLWSFYRPVLLPKDPELIKNILVKDFNYFHDRGAYVNERIDPLSANIFSIEGLKWKGLRIKMTPTFTSGKMKFMFPTLLNSSSLLKQVLCEIADSKGVVELMDIASRFTVDCISSCAFGVETNSLINNSSGFKMAADHISSTNLLNTLRRTIPFINRSLAELFQMRTTDPFVEDFFMKAVKETMNYREANGVTRNDFMELLIQLKNAGELDNSNNISRDTKPETLTFNQAVAQAFIFFIGGFETSSLTMGLTMYELAMNPDIQEKLRKEIVDVLEENGGEIVYESLVHNLEYLGRVVDETLRKYPVVPVMMRECTQAYRIPGTDVTIPKGVSVQIPVYGLHRDPKHFPNPDRYDPDRFTDEEKAKRHNYAYLPFGEGPRSCIGMRFGLLQTKLGLLTMVANFSFEVCKETPSPLVFNSRSFFIQPQAGMHLKITPLKRT